MVDYAGGSMVSETSLDQANQQAIFAAAEADDEAKLITWRFDYEVQGPAGPQGETGPQPSVDSIPHALDYGQRSPLRTIREALDKLNGTNGQVPLHSEIVGFAKVAGTTGGFGFPAFYVNNNSMSPSVPQSFAWALAKAAAAGGGQIFFEPTGKFDIEIADDFLITQSNITLYAPGANVTIWTDRLDGHVNITSGSNWIDKNIYFRPLGGPINGTAIGEASTRATSIINIQSDVTDKFAFLNCEIRHPSWHCLDISQKVPATGHQCRVSVQNCIFWDAIQGHLIGVDPATFGSKGFAMPQEGDARAILVTFHESIWSYNLQRNPKVLGNGYVDMVNCYTLLRPYETEYVDGNGKVYTQVQTDAFGGAVQEGGWLRVRGSLFASAHAMVDGPVGRATHLMPSSFGGGPNATGRISVEDSAAENGMVFEQQYGELIDALPYDLPHTPVPAPGPAREAWLAALWAKAGARPNAAPHGTFVWVPGASAYPNGETVLIDRPRRDAGRYLRVDALTEYPTPPESGSNLRTSPHGYTRYVGKKLGKTSAGTPSLGSTVLDIGQLDTDYFTAGGNGAPATIKYIMSTDDVPIPDGLELKIGGTPTNPATLTNSKNIIATGVNPAASTVTVPAHGMSTGDWPIYFTSSGTLPSGIVSKLPYYVVVVDANTIKLVSSNYTDAVSGDATLVTQIADAGTGTLTAHLGNLNLPNAADILLDRTAVLTVLVWDAASVQWNVQSRPRLQASDITDLSKSSVGLGSVDNTSDANKPVSTAQATALGLKADKSAIPTLASGTYTPTVVGLANCTALTAQPARYIRVGNVVTVTVTIDGTVTATATKTDVSVTLPVASNLGVDVDVSGTVSTSSSNPSAGAVQGDPTGDKAIVSFRALGAAGSGFRAVATFQYTII